MIKKIRLSLFWMVVLSGISLIWLQACSGGIDNAEIRIAADVNRDGRVDFKSDEQGKDRWTLKRGAIFLNNNDSDQDNNVPDHTDDIVNGLEDLKDLAVLKVRKMPGLSGNSRVVFSVDETSKILGCSSLSVRTHLSRARQKIRVQFGSMILSDKKEVKI